MSSDIREYEYRPRWSIIILGVLFFALCAAMMGSAAVDNDRGLIINGIIRFGLDGATVFYWVLAAFSAGFVVLFIFLAYHRLTFQQRLVFGPAAMTGPASRWSKQERQIAYRDITGLSMTTFRGQKFLYIAHPDGKYTIAATMLPSGKAFSEVCELLTSRVQNATLTQG